MVKIRAGLVEGGRMEGGEGQGLVPTGTQWYPMVPSGTQRSQVRVPSSPPVVPTGSQWYPLVLNGTHWWYPVVPKELKFQVPDPAPSFAIYL